MKAIGITLSLIGHIGGILNPEYILLTIDDKSVRNFK